MIKIQHRENGHESRIFFLILIAISVILAIVGAALGSDQKMPIITDLPHPKIPQPQGFCGYCHILTYPSVVQKGYKLWKKGKHNQFGCIECHYPPKGIKGVRKAQAQSPAAGPRYIAGTVPERFSYLMLGGETIQTRPRIVDATCMTTRCHGSPADKFKSKKIKFTEKVSFVHDPHFDKDKQIEGQQINCTSCHQHETDKKKFEVTKASCHLCHFKNSKFNEGRGRCELCHELPKKPVQTSGQEPITHEILKEAKVSCVSCHFEVIQASGGVTYQAYFDNGELKTTLVLGAGRIKEESCLACHDQTKGLKETSNKKLMHEKHVTIKNARCFECHRPIMHGKADLEPPAESRPTGDQPAGSHLVSGEMTVRDSCVVCHPEPHRLQLLLTTGPKREGVAETSSPHLTARANCLACHQEKGMSAKGEQVLKASAQTCVRCHKGRENVLMDWKKELAKEIVYTKGVEKEALDALAKAEAKLPEPNRAEARKILREGQETLNLVQFGNGVHNKKYAIMLLDAALSRFDDLMDYLKKGQ